MTLKRSVLTLDPAAIYMNEATGCTQSGQKWIDDYHYFNDEDSFACTDELIEIEIDGVLDIDFDDAPTAIYNRAELKGL